MKELADFFLKHYLNEFLSTAISLIVLTAIYTIASIFIDRNSKISINKKHRLLISTRNILIIIFLFYFLFIWSGELKTFLLSATALVGALFIVFKEVLLSISGGFLVGNNFNIGDSVEYDGVIGKVSDKTFIYTKVLVSDVYQNKEIIIPNIIFLTNKMTNTSKYGKFEVFKIEIGAKEPSEAFDNGKIMKDIAKKVMQKYKSKYYDYFKELKEKQKSQFLFEMPQLDPQVTYHVGDMKKIYFALHYVAHPEEQGKIEQDILDGYFKSLKIAKEPKESLNVNK